MVVSNKSSISALFLAILFVSGATGAGVPGAPAPVGAPAVLLVDDGVIGANGVPLDVLTRSYRAGNWSALQNQTAALLKVALNGHRHQFDPRANWYQVVFVAQDSRDKPELIRFLLHEPAPLSFQDTLPGVESFYQVFVTHNPEAKYSARYDSTRTAPPIEAELAEFVGQFDPEVLAGLLQRPAPGGAVIFGVKPVGVTRYLTKVEIAKVVLSEERAAISISDRVTVPHVPVPKEFKRIAQSSKDLSKQFDRTARVSSCARGLATGIDTMLQNDLKPGACQPAVGTCAPTQGVCDACDLGGRQVGSKCWKWLACRIDVAYDAYMVKSEKPGKACHKIGVDEFGLVREVHGGFANLVAGKKAAVATLSATLINRPLRRYNLGVVNAFITDDSDVDSRATLSGENQLVADPVGGGPLTMAVLNVHPVRFNPDTKKPTSAERFRGFVGVAFAPEFGLGGGLAIGLSRSISLNIGYAWLVIDEPRAGESLDMDLVNETDPLRQTSGGVVFVGLGYRFEG